MQSYTSSYFEDISLPYSSDPTNFKIKAADIIAPELTKGLCGLPEDESLIILCELNVVIGP